MTAAIDPDQVQSELHRFPEATSLPLVVYHAVFVATGQGAGEVAAESYEALFARNGWGGAWRDGIYRYHHFHATQHEVLGIARGQASVRFNGEDGPWSMFAPGMSSSSPPASAIAARTRATT